jgi:hypothetical protein
MSIVRLIHITLDPSEAENAVRVWKTECAPAHDSAEGMHLGEALALQGRSQIHLLFRVEFRSRHRYLHKQRRSQRDRSPRSWSQRIKGRGKTLRACAIERTPRFHRGCSSPPPPLLACALVFIYQSRPRTRTAGLSRPLTQLWSRLGTTQVVQPETILRWHRADLKAFWRWKSRERAGAQRSIGACVT